MNETGLFRSLIFGMLAAILFAGGARSCANQYRHGVLMEALEEVKHVNQYRHGVLMEALEEVKQEITDVSEPKDD